MRAQVLIVASEAVPLVKTGGLGDVTSALTRALRAHGVDASILIPGYPSALDSAQRLRRVTEFDDLPGGGGTLWHGYAGDEAPVLLLDTPRFRARAANPYVDGDGAEYADNALCFGALAHVAAAICAGRTRWPVPHVVHANDWHAGLIPALMNSAGVRGVGTMLTIHNLAFQGNYPLDVAPQLGVPAQLLTPDALEFWGRLSFLKAGIRFADCITTVSKTYAEEILTPRFGNGLDGLLRQRSDALFAVPNGIDTETWNPADDPLIARHFSARDMRGKAACKRDLQALFNLPQEPFAPMLGIGSRITHQKMADVALAALPRMLDRFPGLQVAVLGCGDRGFERAFTRLAEQYGQRVGVFIGYDERRAHALHAGSDLLLHGTRFEPFGLTPIYAMRYGTIPIGSRVGGLCDTVTDAGIAGAARAGANGVLFDGETPDDMLAAVDRALALFGRGQEWQTLQRNAMAADFSWDGPARQYISLYQEIAPPQAKPWFAAAAAWEPEARPAERPATQPADVPLYATA